MHKNNNLQRGFTITELSLAMTMLSILLIIILLSILQITSTYNKGLTLKRVNQSGSNIGYELQKSLRSSSSNNLVSIQATEISGEHPATRLCTGKVSFVWSVIGNGNDAIEEQFSDGSRISFIKVEDSGGDLCKKADADPNYPKPDKSKSKILLGDDLVIRMPSNVTMSTPITSNETGSASLVTVELTISTPNDSGVIPDPSGRASCQGGKEDDFCALNTFVVTSYAKGI